MEERGRGLGYPPIFLFSSPPFPFDSEPSGSLIAEFLLYYMLLSMVFGVSLLAGFVVPKRVSPVWYTVFVLTATCTALMALDHYLVPDSNILS